LCGHTDDACGQAPCPAGSYWKVVRQACVPAGDLNGDGRADIVSINNSEIDALLSTGSQFVFAKWLDGEFHGYGGAYTADVTGDGYADGVRMVGSETYVATTGGPGFGTEQGDVWSTEPMLGTNGSFIVDVDGDHKADLVALNETIDVALSTGNGFAPSTVWKSGPFREYEDGFFADVNGDDRADAILVSSTFIDVMLSTGASFEDAREWYSSDFLNGWGRFFHDVDGDGRADAIRLTDGAVYVAVSTGTRFEPYQRWFVGEPNGTMITLFGDVDGDNRADLLQVNFSDASVALSTGTAFAPLSVWYTGQFRTDIYFGIAPELASPRAWRHQATP
jgi:hypothetical protein